MRCPKCGCNDDKVIDSRSVRDGFGKCHGTGNVFSARAKPVFLSATKRERLQPYAMCDI